MPLTFRGYSLSVQALADGTVSHDARPRTYTRRRDFLVLRTVRSIQRIRDLTAERMQRLGSLAERYFYWLPQSLFGLIHVEKSTDGEPGRIRFCIRFTKIILLELKPKAHPEKYIERFAITGGLLQTNGSGGFLEFRVIPSENCGLSIVQDFVPRLPWPIYFFSQAAVHLWVMRRFAHFLVHGV